MIGIVYSKLDVAGTNIVDYMVNNCGFRKTEGPGDLRYEGDDARIYEIPTPTVEADFVDSFGCDLIIFPNKHKSEAGIGAFTTHSLGNWRNEAKVGGKPKQLSYAAPLAMISALRNLTKIDSDIEKVYEATHHGPLIKTPAIFVELGGNENTLNNKELASKVGEAICESLGAIKRNDVEYSKVAVGIGGTHYPDKFSSLALEKGYAFSHIMPRYAMLNDDGSDNFDVLEQTLERSTHRPELAVLEWRSLNSLAKEKAIKKLDEIGLDYEKI